MTDAIKTLPKQGFDAQTILNTMQELRGEDASWSEGKCWALVYSAGEEVTDVLRQAFTMFLTENALNPTAFPSLKQMETEVVAMTGHLLGGDAETTGSMTTGGTESILMAMKTAKMWAKKHKRWVRTPEVVLPASAHPAFEKAAYYFGIKTVYAPLSDDYRVDFKRMKKLVNRNTIMLVGSAPAYPQGVVDPIGDIAALAKKKGILCHVDACIGGFVLPFAKQLGYDIPSWDFSVPGVTSMSVDLHKYAYAAKPASVVVYKNAELRKHQFFAFTEWTGGIYASPTMTGSRSGGAIAAAWAVLNFIGHEGYMDIVRRVMNVRDELVDALKTIPEIDIHGIPDGSMVGIGSSVVDIFEVGDNLSEKGWHFDRQQEPVSIHLTVNLAHEGKVEEFIQDLKDAIAPCARISKSDRLKEKIMYGVMDAACTILPTAVVSKATAVASKAMGIGDGELPKKSAAMYGMMAKLPNRGDVHHLVIDALDKLLSYDSTKEIKMITPTTDESIEDRVITFPTKKAKS